MKFLNISDIKLKITLTAEECAIYGIDTYSTDYTTKEVRESVKNILARAESECGFSAAGERILVQLYPLPDGDCEILVTRLSAVNKRDREALSAGVGVSLVENKRGTYRFDSAEHLKLAVGAVFREGVEADLYRDDLGRYYLYVREQFCDDISEFEVLIEYGERLKALPIAVLSEYGVRLCVGTAFSFVMSENFE